MLRRVYSDVTELNLTDLTDFAHWSVQFSYVALYAPLTITIEICHKETVTAVTEYSTCPTAVSVIGPDRYELRSLNLLFSAEFN